MDDYTIDLEKYLFKEVDLVQSIINRMANNSFLIKGWTISLVVVTILFEGRTEHIYIAFLPLIAFWYLDSYFLRQERLYRELYTWIVENRRQTDEKLLDMNAYRFKKAVPGTFKTMLSITLGVFYFAILGITLLAIFILSL